MSKIGDLVVRMRLSYQDYEKGLKNANAKTKTWAGQFGKVVGGMKLGVMAIATAAVALGTELIKSTNKFGDAWQRTMTGAKSAWQSFIGKISSGNFKNLFGGLKDSFKSGQMIADSRDTDFEFEQSLALKRAELQNELNDLNVQMSTADGYREKISAANRYIALLKEINALEVEHWNRRANDELGYWLTTAGIEASDTNIAALKQYFKNPVNDGSIFANAWNNMKSDGTNQVVYDTLKKAAQAQSELSSETLRAQKIIANATEAMKAEAAELEEQKAIIKEGLPALAGISGGIATTDMNAGIAGFDNWIDRFEELRDEAMKTAYALQDASTMMAESIMDGMVNGIQELGYAVAGLENADAGTVVKALLSPLADAAISAGVLIMSTGTAMEALKDAFSNLFGGGPYAAIAAGAALVGIGTAAKVGLAAISKGGSSSGSTSSSTSYGIGDYSSYNSELTVYVKGTIKGSDIVISGQNTLNKWNR